MHITMTSAAKVSTMLDTWVFVVQGEDFQPTAPAKCQETTENANIFVCISETVRCVKGEYRGPKWDPAIQINRDQDYSTPVTNNSNQSMQIRIIDDVTSWEALPHYWPFVMRNHQSLVDSSHERAGNASLWCLFVVNPNKVLNKQSCCR